MEAQVVAYLVGPTHPARIVGPDPTPSSSRQTEGGSRPAWPTHDDEPTPNDRG